MYQAIISILDLAVMFADDQSISLGDKSSFDTSNRSIRNISLLLKPKKRVQKSDHSETDTEESDITDENEENEDENEDESAGQNSDKENEGDGNNESVSQSDR